MCLFSLAGETMTVFVQLVLVDRINLETLGSISLDYGSLESLVMDSNDRSRTHICELS